MKIINVKDYRASLAGYNRSVIQDSDPLIVTGSKIGDVVVMSREDFENLELCLKISRDKQIMEGLNVAQQRLAGKAPSLKTTEDVFADIITVENRIHHAS